MNLNELENTFNSDNEKAIIAEPNIKDVLISIVKLQSAIEQIVEKIDQLNTSINKNSSSNTELFTNKSDIITQKINELNVHTDSIPVQTHRLIEESIKKFDNIEKLKAVLNTKIETLITFIYILLSIVIINALITIYILFF